MNTVVEKLAAIEQEVAAIQPKMLPLSERIADLHEKVTGFTQQLADLVTESATVKQDVERTRQSLAKIQTLIGESKLESEQLAAGQEENQQRCETMTAVFGAAFQAVSQFFETAQRMGLADQAKEVFLPPASYPPALPQPDSPQPELPQPLSSDADSVPPPIEFTEPTVPEDVAETEPAEPAVLPVPSLPDVTIPPDGMTADADSSDLESKAILDSIEDAEPAHEIASQLDVPPLNLAIPDLPEHSEPAADHSDEQDIEAMLATMMAPVTAAAGN